MTFGFSSTQSGAFARRPMAWPIFDQSASTSRPLRSRVESTRASADSRRCVSSRCPISSEKNSTGRCASERGVGRHAESEGGVVHEHVARHEVVRHGDGEVVHLLHAVVGDLDDLVPQCAVLQRPRIGRPFEHLSCRQTPARREIDRRRRVATSPWPLPPGRCPRPRRAGRAPRTSVLARRPRTGRRTRGCRWRR